MNQIIRTVLALMMAVFVGAACSTSEATLNLDHVLTAQGIKPDQAALLVVRLEDGQTWSHGEARIDERFVAASTSKIPHSFIALENGYVAGPETVFQWDGTERWLDAWNQDQTMAEAYERSAVWVFQNIADALGPEAMSAGLQLFDYGNANIGGPERITTYWLTGPLKISAREQVQFLSKLHDEAFPLKQSSYVAGKRIMMAGRTDGRFAKTGWYFSDEDLDIGWYVGWHEVALADRNETYIFAFNMDIEDRESDPPKRVTVVDAALEIIRKSAE